MEGRLKVVEFRFVEFCEAAEFLRITWLENIEIIYKILGRTVKEQSFNIAVQMVAAQPPDQPPGLREAVWSNDWLSIIGFFSKRERTWRRAVIGSSGLARTLSTSNLISSGDWMLSLISRRSLKICCKGNPLSTLLVREDIISRGQMIYKLSRRLCSENLQFLSWWKREQNLKIPVRSMLFLLSFAQFLHNVWSSTVSSADPNCSGARTWVRSFLAWEALRPLRAVWSWFSVRLDKGQSWVLRRDLNMPERDLLSVDAFNPAGRTAGLMVTACWSCNRLICSLVAESRSPKILDAALSIKLDPVFVPEVPTSLSSLLIFEMDSTDEVRKCWLLVCQITKIEDVGLTDSEVWGCMLDSWWSLKL